MSFAHMLIEGITAFYLGHSLVSPTLPQMMAQLMKQPVEYQIINGAPLELNWNDSTKAEGQDGRAWLVEHPIDVLVMTERVPLAGTVQWHGSAEYARKWVDLAAQTNPEVRPFLYETWHSLDSGTGVEVPYDEHGDVPWRQRLNDDLALWQRIADDANRGLPEGRQPIRLIPVGQAFGRLDDAIRDGQIPGIATVRDLFRDDIHPDDRGFYFIAMVHYATITGDSPIGLPVQLSDPWGKPYRAPTAEQAVIFQEIAWQTVQEFTAR